MSRIFKVAASVASHRQTYGLHVQLAWPEPCDGLMNSNRLLAAINHVNQMIAFKIWNLGFDRVRLPKGNLRLALFAGLP